MASTDNITLDLGVEQKGKIKVHTQILNDLSSGIYNSPASCIKELINNSFDAEATTVTVRLKPLEDTITVLDNGHGMNAKDFDSDFAWISKSTKRNRGTISPNLKRPLIGKIGIGFIAVNEICEELEIMSSKKGESFNFTANVNFREYFSLAESEEQSKQPEANGEEGIIKAEYTLINEEEDVDEHYTIITLYGLKPGVKKMLSDQMFYSEELRKKEVFNQNSFMSMKDLILYHKNKNIRSYSEDNEYIKFVFDLASYIPVPYIEDGPIKGVNDPVIDFIKKELEGYDFKVDLDGIYLKKPIYFESNEFSSFYSFQNKIDLFVEDDGESVEDDNTIEYKGYFFIQNKILYPRELNGVSLKIKNVPIAPRYGMDTTFMSYPTYMNQLFKNWVSGEVYIYKGLEPAMNIDRASFRVTHPHYLALQDKIHEILHNKVFLEALRLYERGKNIRENRKKKKKEESEKKIFESRKVTVTPVTSKSRDQNTDREPSSTPINIVKSNKDESIIEIDKSYRRQFRKRDWESIEDVLLIFESAIQECEGDIEKLRKIFYEKIELLKGK